MYYKKLFVPLNLQLFAEESSDNPETCGEGGNEESGGNQQEVKTFTQEQVDNIVKGRIAKERKAWEKHLEDQQTEAKKLEEMTEKEKKAYQDKKREDELTQREKEITKRELTATAKETLAEKGISLGLAQFLDYSNAENCQKSIEELTKVFNEAVEKAVNEKIKGGKPFKRAPEGDPMKAVEQQIYKGLGGK